MQKEAAARRGRPKPRPCPSQGPTLPASHWNQSLITDGIYRKAMEGQVGEMDVAGKQEQREWWGEER